MFVSFGGFGIVRKIKPSRSDRNDRPPSAMLTLQYGHRRDNTGAQVEFVNALVMRVPSHTWARLADSLKEGMVVEVRGKVQGVFKTVVDHGILSSELVVESVRPVKLDALLELADAARSLQRPEAAPEPASAKAEPAPAHSPAEE